MKKNSYFSILLLLLVTTMIASYVAVPVIERIVDSASVGESVFVVGNLPSVEYEEKGNVVERVLDFFFPSAKVEIVENESADTPHAEADRAEAPPTGGESGDVQGEMRKHPRDIDEALMTEHPHDIDREEYGSVDRAPSSVGGGGGGSGWSFKTYDESDSYKAETSVDIFNVDQKIIAPGSHGVYHFTVDNTSNRYNIKYEAVFEEINENGVPMKYDLQIDGQDGYICRDVTAAELKQTDISLSRGAKTRYKLTWRWEYGGNNTSVAELQGGERGTYSLSIKVSANAV